VYKGISTSSAVCFSVFSTCRLFLGPVPSVRNDFSLKRYLFCTSPQLLERINGLFTAGYCCSSAVLRGFHVVTLLLFGTGGESRPQLDATALAHVVVGTSKQTEDIMNVTNIQTALSSTEEQIKTVLSQIESVTEIQNVAMSDGEKCVYISLSPCLAWVPDTLSRTVHARTLTNLRILWCIGHVLTLVTPVGIVGSQRKCFPTGCPWGLKLSSSAAFPAHAHAQGEQWKKDISFHYSWSLRKWGATFWQRLVTKGHRLLLACPSGCK
jgi:hypothetical protein